MLFEPRCFIDFLENNGFAILNYVDNWSDDLKYYFFNEDLVLDMNECIHIDVAKDYLLRLGANNLISSLTNLFCPCSH